MVILSLSKCYIKCVTPHCAINWAACYRFSTWPAYQHHKAVGSEVREPAAKSVKTTMLSVNRRHVCTCAGARSVTFYRCTYSPGHLQCRQHFLEQNCGAQGPQWDSGKPSVFHTPVQELYVLRWPGFMSVSHGTFQIKCPQIPITSTHNLLKPTGHVMHHQFYIQQLYALPTLYLCVLYLSQNKQRLVPLTS